tara:strand:+ start:3641 stop:4048 length:408 start_codon:yes stop_codon:yes gene_type:complete
MTYKIPEGATKKQARAITEYNRSLQPLAYTVQKVESKRVEAKQKPNARLVLSGQLFKTAKGGSTVYEFGPAYQNGEGFTMYTYRKAYTMDDFSSEITHDKLKELDGVTHSLAGAKNRRNTEEIERLEKINHIIYI